jgi:hypothetical protein
VNASREQGGALQGEMGRFQARDRLHWCHRRGSQQLASATRRRDRAARRSGGRAT